MPKDTFTREEVLKIMEKLQSFKYDWEIKKWSMSGHLAPSLIKDDADTLLSRFENNLN